MLQIDEWTEYYLSRPSIYRDIFGICDVYRQDSNSIKEISFSGRFRYEKLQQAKNRSGGLFTVDHETRKLAEIGES